MDSESDSDDDSFDMFDDEYVKDGRSSWQHRLFDRDAEWHWLRIVLAKILLHYVFWSLLSEFIASVYFFSLKVKMKVSSTM